MTPKKAAAYFVVATLSAAWFASAVGMPPQSRPPRRTAAPVPDEALLDSLARDVQAQSSRLRQRLATAPSVQFPARNPFSFGRRAAVPREAAPVRPAYVPPEAIAEPAPREPLLALIGVAEENKADGVVRTAMISEEGEDLHMATAGQTIGGRYLVVAISADAVELKDVASGAIRRLALR